MAALLTAPQGGALEKGKQLLPLTSRDSSTNYTIVEVKVTVI